MKTSLTVYFEDPFWVGVFERIDEGKYSVCKVTFGAEPTDAELWEFVQRHYTKLTFSPAEDADVRQPADNPKRRQRSARKLLSAAGVGTKAQQALQKQREEQKTERKEKSRELRETEMQRRFALRQQKKKEKHRGH